MYITLSATTSFGAVIRRSMAIAEGSEAPRFPQPRSTRTRRAEPQFVARRVTGVSLPVSARPVRRDREQSGLTCSNRDLAHNSRRCRLLGRPLIISPADVPAEEGVRRYPDKSLTAVQHLGGQRTAAPAGERLPPDLLIPSVLAVPQARTWRAHHMILSFQPDLDPTGNLVACAPPTTTA